MTCRHAKGDPNCSSSANYVGRYDSGGYVPKTPDASNYTVEEIERVGPHLVLRVKYPNCANCNYEGNKIMVFLSVTEAQVLRWRKIDPHFRDPKRVCLPADAPSPAARFPGNAEGWADAIAYAKFKARGDYAI